MTCQNSGRIAASLVFIFALGVLAAAQTPGPPTQRPGPAARPSVYELPQQPAQSGQPSEFVPLKDLVRDKGLPPAQERIPAAPLVMGAYAFVWVALLLYVWSVWRRVGAVQRELADLRRRTERKA